MPKLPLVSGQEVIKALSKAGFQTVGRKGSHIRLKKKTPIKTYIVIVPLSPRNKKGNTKINTQTSRTHNQRIHKIIEEKAEDPQKSQTLKHPRQRLTH